MFLKRKMNDSTNSYSDKILQIKEKIGEADAIIIGAGAGFSTSAGFVYNGERFEKYFSNLSPLYTKPADVENPAPAPIIIASASPIFSFICNILSE